MDVVFVDGVHYRVNDDGHADHSQPLRWDPEAGDYRPAEDGDLLHNAQYASAPELLLEPGSEDE